MLFKIDGDVFYHQADVFALLVGGFNHFVADVIATWYSCTRVCAIGDYYVWLVLLPKWLMLLPLEAVWAGIIALWLMLLPLIVRLLGWCYCLVADVTAIYCLVGWCYCLVADVIASCSDGRCYCLVDWCKLSTVGVGGRWNSHWVNALVLILLFCVIPHPICVADGII